MFAAILSRFGLNPELFQVEQLQSGLINRTWKITGAQGSYVLQRLNTEVFKVPELIVDNLAKIAGYLRKIHPEYPLVAPLPAHDGSFLVRDEDGHCYRLLPYVRESETIQVVSSEGEAFQAAQQFGRFTSRLAGFDAQKLKPTIADFHNLLLRFNQFEEAVGKADADRLSEAQGAIKQAYLYADTTEVYGKILRDAQVPLRVIHHDTKISNVLFDQHGRGICVIDLDTVMGGRFFSDVGDMMRTYLSPANEEETNFSKIEIRTGYFKAIVEGYFSEMGNVLTKAEKELFIYSGKFLIYMQALRFLTDFLNRDIYYPTRHALHNLVRAENQFHLLEKYVAGEETFQSILAPFLASETRIDA